MRTRACARPSDKLGHLTAPAVPPAPRKFLLSLEACWGRREGGFCGAGRPQFDTSAVAVIMTQAQHAARYRGLAGGHSQLESRLHGTLPEFLNAEVAMRVVTTVAQAHRWFQSTFLWVRLLQNPAHYGLAAVAGGGPQAWQALAGAALTRFLDGALARLEAQGLLQVQRATGAIVPLAPSECAPVTSAHNVSLTFCAWYATHTTCNEQQRGVLVDMCARAG